MARDSRFNTEQSKLTSFSLKRKALASSYTSIKNVYNYFNSNRSANNSTIDLTNINNGSQIDEYFKNIGSKNDRCIALSNALY